MVSFLDLRRWPKAAQACSIRSAPSGLISTKNMTRSLRGQYEVSRLGSALMVVNMTVSRTLGLFRSWRRSTGSGWRMLTLEVIYDRDTMTPDFPGMLPAPATFDTTDHRDSYRCIGWLIASKGFEVNRDLPGTDGPESIASLMSERFAWLRSL